MASCQDHELGTREGLVIRFCEPARYVLTRLWTLVAASLYRTRGRWSAHSAVVASKLAALGGSFEFFKNARRRICNYGICGTC